MGESDGLKDLGSNLPRPGINSAGLGVTVGDWQVGFIPVTSTDSRYDLEQETERAERHDEDVREAKQLGEQTPDPVGDYVRKELDPEERSAPSADPMMASIRSQIAAHDATQGQKGTPGGESGAPPGTETPASGHSGSAPASAPTTPHR